MRGRLQSVLGALVVLVALLAIPAVARADGGSLHTWQCTDTNAPWSRASCWKEGSPPHDGDSVLIEADTPVQDVPQITLKNLTYHAGFHGHLDSPDGILGGITVTGHLDWTGGAINMPLTIAPGATAELSSQTPKAVQGDLTVQGTMTLDSLGGEGGGGGLAVDIPKVTDANGEYDLMIAPGGRLVSHGPSMITGASCCAQPRPGTVLNRGTISVDDGALTVRSIAFDQAGSLEVADGAGLDVTDTIARLGDGSTYTGPGTLTIAHAGSPDPHPQAPGDNQGAALLEGAATFVRGFHLALTDRTPLTGVGRFAGSGSLTLDHATVYGTVRTGPRVGLRVAGEQASHIGTWNGTRGYVGHLTLGGRSTIAPGSELDTDAGGTLTVARGGSLSIPAGAALAGPGTTDTPALVNARGGVVRFGAGSGAPAQLRHDRVRNDGTLLVAGPTSWDGVGATQPDGTLRLDATLTSSGDYAFGAHSTVTVGLHGRRFGRLVLAGAARLAGTVRTAGRGSHARGRHLAVLRATSRHGRFGCARTVGWLPAYTPQGVRLTGLGVTTPTRCGHPVRPATRLRRGIGHRAVGFRVPHGHARYVLLAVTARARHAGRLIIRAKHGGRGVVRLRAHRTVHHYLVVRVGAAARFTARVNHGRAKVTVRYLARYR